MPESTPPRQRRAHRVRNTSAAIVATVCALVLCASPAQAGTSRSYILNGATSTCLAPAANTHGAAVDLVAPVYPYGCGWLWTYDTSSRRMTVGFGWCMDTYYAGRVAKTPVVIGSCVNNGTQFWDLVPLSGGFVGIRNAGANMCLTAAGTSTQIDPCNLAGADQWWGLITG